MIDNHKSRSLVSFLSASDGNTLGVVDGMIDVSVHGA
eukprot:CAMPEP_0202690094 /NCGR_PEP_ID=MMETSP1385-20130828/5209_1 /ASSEMBLY_ACC=CAM_ASM_000861 /TAXON_ID=933848 /ORGANISM="Elphidium margaritaceum" /LENGTH=36 /DNA_ID= /DNA_START= /DNA_END= /DNA_ORIENTATION=